MMLRPVMESKKIVCKAGFSFVFFWADAAFVYRSDCYLLWTSVCVVARDRGSRLQS